MRNEAELDKSGKVILTHIYNQPDPRQYFSVLSEYEYKIPGEAAEIFRKIISAWRESARADGIRIIDLGCSYGINAAVLKHGLGMADLYRRYTAEGVACLDRAQLVARDRAFYAKHVIDPQLEIVGIDVAERAIGYAMEAGLLNGGIAADLERESLPRAVREAVAGAGVVISTGCIGYARTTTVGKILDARSDRTLWMAHFVLRIFSYEPFEELFARHGYVTETLPGTFPQRRFASQAEEARALGNLEKLGLDPTGKEADGWFHAQFYLSRPAETAKRLPLGQIFNLTSGIGVADSRRPAAIAPGLSLARATNMPS